jgi:hypothetical protein
MMLGYCCLTSHHNTIDDHGYKLAPKIARMGEVGHNQNGSLAPIFTENYPFSANGCFKEEARR